MPDVKGWRCRQGR